MKLTCRLQNHISSAQKNSIQAKFNVKSYIHCLSTGWPNGGDIFTWHKDKGFFDPWRSSSEGKLLMKWIFVMSQSILFLPCELPPILVIADIIGLAPNHRRWGIGSRTVRENGKLWTRGVENVPAIVKGMLTSFRTTLTNQTLLEALIHTWIRRR